MRPIKTGFRTVLATVLVTTLQLPLADALEAAPDDPKLANKRCLMCHGKEGFERDGRDLAVMAGVFDSSVHASQDCVGCHEDITKVCLLYTSDAADDLYTV